MTSKELIKVLQEIDPNGEMEVCVGLMGVYHVSINPCGSWVQAVDVKHGRFTQGRYFNNKNYINLYTCSIKDAMANNPKMGISIEACSDAEREVRQQVVDSWRSTKSRAYAAFQEAFADVCLNTVDANYAVNPLPEEEPF